MIVRSFGKLAIANGLRILLVTILLFPIGVIDLTARSFGSAILGYGFEVLVAASDFSGTLGWL